MASGSINNNTKAQVYVMLIAQNNFYLFIYLFKSTLNGLLKYDRHCTQYFTYNFKIYFGII